MTIDIRVEAAKYYDRDPEPLDDIPFYKRRIPSPRAKLLELGCGTGRVLVPLAGSCAYIHGVDASPAMLSICRDKLGKAQIPATEARVEIGDIANLNLGKVFDLITAPYRVFQNLETDAEVRGFFESVHRHLASEGRCILNVFMPNREPAALREEWISEEEYPCWEVPIEGGRITCHGKNARMDKDKMILYPELIYRTYRGGTLQDEAILKIVMRCYYPDEFEQLIVEHGFEVICRWGGYAGQVYGKGPELIVEFKEAP